jgi:hypothetical protein
MKCKLLRISQIGFQQNLWSGLWEAWQILFMASWEVGFIMDQYR